MYSKSPITLMRRREHIEPLFRGETTRWTSPFPGNRDAASWAYCVRECLNVAKKNPRRFPDLAQFADKYQVEILDERTVQASRPAQTENGAIGIVTGGTDTQALTFTEAATYPDAITRYDIVQVILRSGRRDGRYHFPKSNLAPADVSKLAAWAINEGLFVLRSTGEGITIVPTSDNIPLSARVIP